VDSNFKLISERIKFRANDMWDLNFGDTGANGSLENGDNIKVPSAEIIQLP
jgi:hypothetical protein